MCLGGVPGDAGVVYVKRQAVHALSEGEQTKYQSGILYMMS